MNPHHPRCKSALTTQHRKVRRCQLHHSVQQGHSQCLQCQRHHHHCHKRRHLAGMAGHGQQVVANPTGGCSSKCITDTIIVNRPPTEFLPDCPPTEETIHNIYELKTSPELFRYLHAKTAMDHSHQKQAICIVAGTISGRSMYNISPSPTRPTKATEGKPQVD